MRVGILYNSGQDGKSKVMRIELPFMGAQNFLILPNKEKTNENAPDFNVMMQVAGKLTNVGAIWNKVSEKGTSYKSLTLEHPFAYMGKLYLAIFDNTEAETFKNTKGVDCPVTHVVNWNAPQKKDRNFDNQDYGVQTPQVTRDDNYPTPPQIDIEDDEIPF